MQKIYIKYNKNLDVDSGFPQPKKSITTTTAYPFPLKVRSHTSYLDTKEEAKVKNGNQVTTNL
jgi:hypothetical protein